MVMERKLLFVLLLILLSTSALAEEDCLLYFYGQDCKDCQATDQFLKQVEQSHPGIQIHKLEVYREVQNKQLMDQYFAAYNIPEKSRQIPVIFMPGSYFIGRASIEKLVESRIESNTDPSCPSLEKNTAIGIIGAGAPSNVLDTLTFFLVTGRAFKDSISPAHVAVLLLFLLLLSSIREEDKMIKRGVLFLISAFFVHVLYGMGVFTAMSNTNIHIYFYKFISICAMIYGLISIRSYFKTWHVLMNSIPENITRNLKTIKNTLQSVTAVFLGGFLGAVLSLPELGTTYALLQELLTEQIYRLAAFPLILYYSLIILLPLIILLLLVHTFRIHLDNIAQGKIHSDMQRKYWQKHNDKIIQILMGSLVLALGVILLFL